MFAHKSLSVIVATDVAARGIDVKNLDLVVNYELSRDPEVHVHRVGRTGRAGEKGTAISFVCGSKEAHRLSGISEYLDMKLNTVVCNDEMQALKITPPMSTIKISGGKKNKIRPGDVLGSLVKEMNIKSAHIGKITLFDFYAYVAVSYTHLTLPTIYSV